jgi:DNA-directed RNA polymerase subunit RPC12/RpoP
VRRRARPLPPNTSTGAERRPPPVAEPAAEACTRPSQAIPIPRTSERCDERRNAAGNRSRHACSARTTPHARALTRTSPQARARGRGRRQRPDRCDTLSSSVRDLASVACSRCGARVLARGQRARVRRARAQPRAGRARSNTQTRAMAQRALAMLLALVLALGACTNIGRAG